jgi:hypothetical protein
MSRPRTYTVAAVLMVVYSALIVLSELPYLFLGAVAAGQLFDGNGSPFLLSITNFALGVLGFPAAYGVWTMQKWGVVLTIVLNAFNALTALLPIMLAPPILIKLLSGLALIWAIAIIVLLLWPQPKSSPAVDGIR